MTGSVAYPAAGTSKTACWQASRLAVGFGRRPLVADITFTLLPGEMLAITGANGTGKSCLLRTLSGELTSCAGSWQMPAGVSKADLGVVPQAIDIKPRVPLSLREMASLGRVGRRHADQGQNLNAALDIVGLGGQRGHQAWQRSSGGGNVSAP